MNIQGLLILLVLLLAVFSLPAKSEKMIIFNMGDKEYPPYMSFDGNNGPQGIMYDVLSFIAKKHQYKIIPVKMSKNRVRVSLANGKLDATPRAMEWESNPDNYIFTEPIVVIRDSLFSPKKQPVAFERIEELMGLTIILRKGYIYPTLEKLINIEDNKILYANSEKNMLTMLKHQRAKAAVISEYVGLWIIKQQHEQGLYYIAKKPIDKVDYRIMFSKKWSEFVQVFNDNLRVMKKKGIIDRIVSKYIGVAPST